MSLILEALRKSEAERRRGQTPDLLTDAIPVAPTARRTTPNWTALLPLAGAALIALLLVIWWLRPSAEPIANGNAANAASVDATVAAEEPAVSNAATAVQAPPPALSPPAMRSSTPAAMPDTPTPPASASVAQAVPASAATSSTRAPEPPVAEPAPPSPTPAQVASLDPAPTPGSANTPAFSSPDAPLKLSDLSPEDRAQLPALKVSMHMWSPETGSRFAIIDGARVNEGDRVGEAAVGAIQQDSIMLSWRGRQIRLPIR